MPSIVKSLVVTNGRITAGTDGDVDLADMADLSGPTLLVGSGGGGGAIAEITLGAGLTMTGNELSAAGSSYTADEVTLHLAAGVFSIKSGYLGTLATQSGTFSGTSSGTNTGDQTSIVGITGTKAEFNAACSDGDFLFVGDVTGLSDGDYGDAAVSGSGTIITVESASGAFALSGVTTDTTISGTVADYDPGDAATVAVTAPGGTPLIRGIAGGTGGRILILRNTPDSLRDLILEDGTGSAGNQCDLGGDVTLVPGTEIALHYHAGESTWSPLAQSFSVTLNALSPVDLTLNDGVIWVSGGTPSVTDSQSFVLDFLQSATTADARANIGCGTAAASNTGDFQAADAELAALAGLTSAADKLPYFTGSGTAALADFTAAGRALIDDADAAAQRTTLGLGTAATHATGDYDAAGAAAAAQAASQPLDADLTAIAALATDAFGRGALTQTSAANFRTYIGAGTSSFSGAFSALSGIPTTLGGYGITDAQPLDATLTAFAALTIAANSLTVGTGADAFSQTAFAANTFPARASAGNLVAKTITDFGLSLVDDADAAAGRTTLGLGTSAVIDTGTSGTKVALTDGANSWSAAQTFINASGVKILDTDASHTLGIVGGSNLTATRTLTVTTGDASRILTFTADASIGGTHSGTSSGTNTGDQTSIVGITGTKAQFNTACTDGDFLFVGDVSGISDGDKGDITVSGSGATWTIDSDVVTYAKMQDVSATQRFLGRNTAGAGDPEEVTPAQAADWYGVGMWAKRTQDVDATIPAGRSAVIVGPLTINSGITLTIGSGAALGVL